MVVLSTVMWAHLSFQGGCINIMTHLPVINGVINGVITPISGLKNQWCSVLHLGIDKLDDLFHGVGPTTPLDIEPWKSRISGETGDSKLEKRGGGCLKFTLLETDWNSPLKRGLFQKKTRWWFHFFFEFSSLFGEDSHFDERIFQMGWNHQLESRTVFQWTIWRFQRSSCMFFFGFLTFPGRCFLLMKFQHDGHWCVPLTMEVKKVSLQKYPPSN